MADNSIALEIADMANDGFTDEEIRQECEERASEAGVSAAALYRASASIYDSVYS